MKATFCYVIAAFCFAPLWAVQTYVAASQGNLVRISNDGLTVTTIATGVVVKDLAVESTGNIVGAAVSKIQRVTPAGVVTTVASAPAGSQYISLALDGFGNIIVADNAAHAVWRISPDGLTTTFVSAYPVLVNTLDDVFIRVDAAGNYILGTDNASAIKLYKITPLGAVTPIPLAGNYAPVQLGGLTLDPSGAYYYVADSITGRVLRIATNGLFTTIASGTNLAPLVFGLAFNATSNEVVASVPGGGRLVRIAPDGSAQTPVATTTPNAYVAIDYGISGGGAPGALRFVPVTPCRVADTRAGQGTTGFFGPPSMAGGTMRTFPIPLSTCNIPATAKAYAVNVTVVPQGSLSYLTLWPAGQTQPNVSTLNSFSGKVLANAAIVPAGTGGGVNVYVTGTTDVILDVNGYFDAAPVGLLGFFPVPPCRVSDTRVANGPFGNPSMFAGETRVFPVPASACGLPAGASAYSLNATVVPPGPLGFLTLFPAGDVKPFVSTLNSGDGRILANAAIVPAGAGGGVSAYVTNATDVILDANGYFATGTAGFSFYTVPPCRVVDTRNANGSFGGPILAGGTSRDFVIPAGTCGIPASARAYSLNVTVAPSTGLGFLTIWPTAQPQPFVSTLNSGDGSVVANAAIVPAGAAGGVSVFATNTTHVILDINGYFAP